jgi:type IV pilus assembly protein PilA
MPTMPRTTPGTAERGSSFVELLVVIVILGTLASIAIAVFLGQRDKAVTVTAASDLRNAATAEEAEFAGSGAYTTDLTVLGSQGFQQTTGVQLGVAVSTVGYCEAARTGAGYRWFDSAAGGLQATTTATLAPPSSAGGACRAAAPSAVS